MRGREYASKLLSHLLAMADQERRHCFLEANNESASRLYERHGFRIVASPYKPGGDVGEPLIYPMARAPSDISQ